MTKTLHMNLFNPKEKGLEISEIDSMSLYILVISFSEKWWCNIVTHQFTQTIFEIPKRQILRIKLKYQNTFVCNNFCKGRTWLVKLDSFGHHCCSDPEYLKKLNAQKSLIRP